jgi:hypothetical protein
MVAKPDVPATTDSGWHIEDDALKPILMTTAAVSPKCLQLASCNCQETG